MVAQDGSNTVGDVYVNDLKPLQEGEEKHVISVFVADEPGLINRVAGVFGRRGGDGRRGGVWRVSSGGGM